MHESTEAMIIETHTMQKLILRGIRMIIHQMTYPDLYEPEISKEDLHTRIAYLDDSGKALGRW